MFATTTELLVPTDHSLLLSGNSVTIKTQEAIALEKKFVAATYIPLPVVLKEGRGSRVYDVQGKAYIDMLGASSAMSHGHCHPRVVQAMHEQAQKLCLSSRPFHSDLLGPFAKMLCELTGFDKMLPVNSGAEANEVAMKVARKWAYQRKGISKNTARILSVTNNFHGRTLATMALSSFEDTWEHFGPNLGGTGSSISGKDINFNNADDMKQVLDEYGHEIAAIILEPIQGEGVIIPSDSYLYDLRELCNQHNILLIFDEVHTGLGRTGQLMAHQHWPGLRPDIVTLGKALSGGTFPISAVLADDNIMSILVAGDHGSTFAGSQLASAVGMASLQVLVTEDLVRRSKEQGEYFLDAMQAVLNIGRDEEKGLKPYVKSVRGKGMLIGFDLDPSRSTKGRGTWELCLIMMSKGVITRPLRNHRIRFAPPLSTTREDIDTTVRILQESLALLDVLGVIPGQELATEP